mgnify:CR=1 FL=1
MIDAAGKYVMPGCIDPHTHLEMSFGGTVTCDDFTGTDGQPGTAVLGTVEGDVVTDEQDGVGNPEGAAVVS